MDYCIKMFQYILTYSVKLSLILHDQTVSSYISFPLSATLFLTAGCQTSILPLKPTNNRFSNLGC